MLNLVIKDLRSDNGYRLKYELCELEVQRKKVSWTIDTINELGEKYQNDNLYCVIGSDSYFQLHTWKSYADIINKVNFVIIRRDNNMLTTYKDYYENYLEMVSYDKFIFIDNEPLIVSSTKIRTLIDSGNNASALLPAVIYDYIIKNSLYKTDQKL